MVLGAGAGGMTAALVAAVEGMRTLLIEKSDQIGGTTALSSGTVWIPNNSQQRELGIDDRAAALQYLDALVGDLADRELREAFLAAGPSMLDCLGAHTDLRFRMYRHQPDYRQDLPGAALGGRPLEPLPFDGRTLGDGFASVRWPIPELMLLGGMMITRSEAERLKRIGRNLDSLRLGLGLLSRYALDRLRFKRGTRLVLGNALAARLYRNLLDRRVPVWLGARTTRLVREHGRAAGVVVERDGSAITVHARRAVVLAGGGFPASKELRERYFPDPVATHTAAFDGCVGDTIVMAQGIGAALGESGLDNALWFPSSLATRRDGSVAVYPHIVLDRGKPGLVAVDAAGKRFVNEAVSYHEFTRAMYASNSETPTIPAWLVCDRTFLWNYGLGLVRPLTPSIRGFVRRGYLKTARSVRELAGVIGVDADGLIETVAAANRHARYGKDEEFGKGENAYDLASGDAGHSPNPCLGPIERPPFYAVAVFPTPLGTSLGLRTDAKARVLDAAGVPIPGLFACGNDMHSPMGGEYPGAGAQLGLAMTFGYLAAMHAAAGGVSSHSSAPSQR